MDLGEVGNGKRLLLLFTLVGLVTTLFLNNISAQMPSPTPIDNSEWTRTLIQQEFDNNGDGQPDVFTTFTQINKTLIQIDVTQTNYDGKGGKAYKWQSGLFADSLEGIKVYYEDAQGGFENSYGQDCVAYDYQWTTGWNHSGSSVGCALFGGGNSNHNISFRINVPENIDNFKISTGENSEEVEYNLTNDTDYLYPTSHFELNGLEADFFCNDIKLEFPVVGIIADEILDVGVKFSLNVSENYTCNGTFKIRQNTNEVNFNLWNNQFKSEDGTYFMMIKKMSKEK